MNNGDFNRPSSPETEEPSYRRLERKPLLPLLVLIFGILGCFNFPFSVAAAVVGFADRHTSETWDRKSKIGTILGCAALGIIVLAALFWLAMYLWVPNYTAILEAELRKNAAAFSSAILPRLG